MKKNLLVLVLTITFGCNSNDESIPPQQVVNTFTMTVNDSQWTPTLIDNDECYSKFNCFFSEVDFIPLYTITAIKENETETDQKNSEKLWFRIMNLKDVDTYYLNDEYGDFKSFARFIINENGIVKIYENSTSENSSKVIIEDIIPPTKNSHLGGVRGIFSGVLYNKNDTSDFIIIRDCNFEFEKTNRTDYYQCLDY
ncbi:DUF5025 domain-containing protein [Flavivirga jejuensis]|uniref:DUF5025 domain-containing protein n=1 Tax=Flavivirga jejuensis TaxID=870487 RepID=A0ABT8WLC5_9FLAO|nr:DUF5025 domain-containing protein [Flavivirga jejuensis]MDO5973957.1 DUF5025 domain-containing protein [Flavivirga jejuensis]